MPQLLWLCSRPHCTLRIPFSKNTYCTKLYLEFDCVVFLPFLLPQPKSRSCAYVLVVVTFPIVAFIYINVVTCPLSMHTPGVLTLAWRPLAWCLIHEHSNGRVFDSWHVTSGGPIITPMHNITVSKNIGQVSPLMIVGLTWPIFLHGNSAAM